MRVTVPGSHQEERLSPEHIGGNHRKEKCMCSYDARELERKYSCAHPPVHKHRHAQGPGTLRGKSRDIGVTVASSGVELGQQEILIKASGNQRFILRCL